MTPVIMHCDMNNCFASIECILNPSLKGRPIAVCGSREERRGIVLAKSEEAKKYGVKTGDTVWEAEKKCPGLIIVPPHHNVYSKYSELAKKLYSEYTDRIEPFGLDECWLDVTASIDRFKSSEEMALSIKERIKKEIGLTISIGISFNKIFAKLGSDMKKPDAITLITETNFKTKIWPLPASDMLGVGRKTSKKLESFGIRTIGEIANSDPDFLKNTFGINGTELWLHANGLDFSQVKHCDDKRKPKSISHGATLAVDLQNNEQVWSVLLELAKDVSEKLYRQNLRAQTVRISVRDNKLIWYQFQAPLATPTTSYHELAQAGRTVFEKNYSWNRDIRALCITACDFSDPGKSVQLDLFCNQAKHNERRESLEKTILSLNEKFGKNIVCEAVLLNAKNKKPD